MLCTGWRPLEAMPCTDGSLSRSDQTLRCSSEAHIVWADREALGGAITEIDTTAVLTRHDRLIDNPPVETGASSWARAVTTTAAPTPTQPGCRQRR
jgi:hypothetical protein